MSAKPTIGILLLNTGTPIAPTKAKVRQYLKQFLSDPRVIDINPIVRWLLLHLLILPFRARSSAHAYQQIWTKDGSPLLVNSSQFSAKLQHQLGRQYRVQLGMCYGQPSIEHAIASLEQEGVSEIKILPLFPQYASASTGAVLERSLTILAKQKVIIPFRVLPTFYAHANFITAWVKLIAPVIKQQSTDFLLLSYHGLPKYHITQVCRYKQCNMDEPCKVIDSMNQKCYRAQCYTTSNLIAKELNLNAAQYGVSFQSRLGKIEWIKPYTDEYVVHLRKKGVNNLIVACPAFVADCLETLEEIGMQARAQWQALGGKNFTLIPCLNDDEQWVQAVAQMVD
jgi:ferrochelatase